MVTAVPCVSTTTHPQSCSVRRRREETLAFGEGDSLTNRERQIKVFESQRVVLHRGRNHPHEDLVADRGFHPGIIFIWHTHYCADQQSHENSIIKDSKERRMRRSLIAKRLANVLSLVCLYFHRQKHLLPSTYVEDKTMAGRKASLAQIKCIWDVRNVNQ